MTVFSGRLIWTNAAGEKVKINLSTPHLLHFKWYIFGTSTFPDNFDKASAYYRHSVLAPDSDCLAQVLTVCVIA